MGKNNKKESYIVCNSLIIKWCHQESNRGHKDFQSFALPTELWHHHFLFAGAKVGFFFGIGKFLPKKLHEFEKNAVPLHSLLRHRDVAQLVAHYVRDVGVGRSSRLIPTGRRKSEQSGFRLFHSPKGPARGDAGLPVSHALIVVPYNIPQIVRVQKRFHCSADWLPPS